MLTIPRKNWALNPIYSGKIPWISPAGIAIHHTAGAAPTEHPDCKAAVQSIEKQYQSKPEYRYAPYNFVVCRHGFIYIMRGFGDQGGANGTADSNRLYLSICLLGNAPTITPQRARAIRIVRRRWLKRFPAAIDVFPHSHFVPTACPGNDARAYIQDKGYKVNCPQVALKIKELEARIEDLRAAQVRGRCP